tara:strand:- start:471 stop:1208 length:738 start_codon:yes stop_codon:yes gene_type:complete
MLNLKSNTWYKRLLTSIFSIALVVCLGTTVQANNGGGGNTGGGGTGGGGAGAGGTQITGGSDLVDLQEEFIGDVDRTGGVGQFSEPVGASVTSAAASLSTTGARATTRAGGGLGGLGGLGAAFNNALNGGLNGGTEATMPIRTRLRSAVELPPVDVDVQIAREVSLNNRLQRTSSLGPRPRGPATLGAEYGPASQPLYGVNVQMQGRTAILQGTVSSEAHRRRSELLIRLEPGVSQIDNRISVAP